MIQFDKVVKAYGALQVLKDLDFSVDRGEVVSIIGPSGSGKTTVLRVLMTLEGIQGGTMFVDGEPLNKMNMDGQLVDASKAHIRRIRSKIGMVFQNFNLFPHMTALENCNESPIYTQGKSKAEATEESMRLLEMVGLADKSGHYPSQLSGGQQQRVAIARTLAMHPEILLFDEPTSALDPEMVGEVLQVIRDLAKSGKYTILLVTHQMGFAREVSDRVCFFDGGKMVEQGKPDDVFGNPQNARLQQFLSKVLEAG
ncbi:ectoine/hydroxyectoine ABC transporter ATP-binding protein EhuA [Ruegeria lacuscaerulensis]|uniref:ectoine/hydroxyectoine ABC transporter ATP-binding protein EhuA n=1 Tax=Ruegeria lacuscaerulensis TaxID=55218 RepID=UPI00147B0FC2|nr:ectoine/hydroxyectoine ABC transporter ATP-binding protein EhuA [Ruegeria lacuscaerulensis]